MYITSITLSHALDFGTAHAPEAMDNSFAGGSWGLCTSLGISKVGTQQKCWQPLHQEFFRVELWDLVFCLEWL
jgi:hypothetical protein